MTDQQGQNMDTTTGGRVANPSSLAHRLIEDPKSGEGSRQGEEPEVIWEFQELDCRHALRGETLYAKVCTPHHHLGDWQVNNMLSPWVQDLAKFAASLYRRLQEQEPTLPEGYVKVEHPKNYDPQFIQAGDMVWHDETWTTYEPQSGAWHMGCCYGLAYGNGWVARKAPEPVKEWPQEGDTYWVEDITDQEFATDAWWRNEDLDLLWKERGLIHRTKEDAVKSCKARLGLSHVEGKEEV